ncbi:hypothetical protein [Mesorhizobium sp. Root172]|uniref:hypothetical protein n=1 Tax=Mesorhizobium sp. Root172 TaxID=1736481 RepID=UPI0012E3B788|nr:hypothetical protein [Mesorhizobium sp. Root172]
MQSSILRAERTSRLGRIGEILAEERLRAAGFEGVRNLNLGINFPYADIMAIRSGQGFLIGVKSRNEFQTNGRINPCYNAVLIADAPRRELERRGKAEADITALLWSEVDELARQADAVPAWVAIAMRPMEGTYSAYFGLASAVRHRRSIPMKLRDRTGYVELAPAGTKDERITPDLLNRD